MFVYTDTTDYHTSVFLRKKYHDYCNLIFYSFDIAAKVCGESSDSWELRLSKEGRKVLDRPPCCISYA